MSFEPHFERGRRLSELSTFGIGGKARFFIEVKTIEQVQELRLYLSHHPLPYWVLGRGSNVLFDDRGFDGLVILNKIDFIKNNDHCFEVGTGYNFSLLGNQTARQGFAGLEFASGIPGSVGGAIYMNAGANGTETCDFLTIISYVDREGNLVETAVDRQAFGYRSSPFQQMDVILVAATFALKKDQSAREKQLAIVRYRLKTQPYSEKSAGCIFRNPDTMSAGMLIDRAGLKGKRIGEAEISMQHANFIINRGKATAQDILALARYVQSEVEDKTGYKLELELQRVPYRVSPGSANDFSRID
ncbi:MAG: UDP-N-acetylmuramate dehydrogenase [Chlamydiota bacterium]